MAGEAQLRVSGSLAFVAAARAAHVVVLDPEDEGRRLLLRIVKRLLDHSHEPQPLDGFGNRESTTLKCHGKGVRIST